MKYAPLLLLFGCFANFPYIAPPGDGAGMNPAQATVYMYLDDCRRASAVAIGSHLLVTAAHAVSAEPGCDGQTGAIIRDGSPPMDTLTSWSDPSPDSAVLRAAEHLPVKAKFTTRRPVYGQELLITGYGCAQENMPFHEETRHVRYVGMEGGYLDLVGLSCPGDSGGGIFYLDGTLVGITDYSGTGYEKGHIYAAPLDQLALP